MYGSILSLLLMGMVPAWSTQEHRPVIAQELRIAPPVPSTALPSLVVLDGQLSASGVLIVDLESGQQLYTRQADVARPMASLTKLMTALLIAEQHDLTESVTIPASVEGVAGNVVSLKPGETYAAGDLLTALLVASANDAAYALAVFHGSTVEGFVRQMNERAAALGLADTSFENPAGLDDSLQHSSPRDLGWLAMTVLRRPEIAGRLALPSAVIRSHEGTTTNLLHTYLLLRQREPGVLGGKTGTTDAAGQCLLSIVEAGGRRLGIVLLGSRDRIADMRQILAALAF